MAAKKKVKVLSESKVADAYRVTAGFNYPDGKGGEKRVEAKSIVFEKDYSPEVWKALLKLEAVRQIVEPEPLHEGESIAAEVIG
jgi:hypothetical protein